MNTLSPLTELKGIGEKTEKLFAKVGVTNVGELLSYYPRTYETYGEIQKPDAVTDGMTAALYGQFQGPLAVKPVCLMCCGAKQQRKTDSWYWSSQLFFLSRNITGCGSI